MTPPTEQSLAQALRDAADTFAVAVIFAGYMNREGSGRHTDAELIEYAVGDLEDIKTAMKKNRPPVKNDGRKAGGHDPA